MASSSVRASRSSRWARPSSVADLVSVEPAALDQGVAGHGPLLVGAGPGALEHRPWHLAGGGVDDQRLQAGDPLLDQAGDVGVAAELPQQGHRMPQHQVGGVGPVEGGVGRVQGPAVEGAAVGRLPGQPGGLGHVVTVDGVTQDPPQGGVDAGQSGVEQISRTGQRPGGRDGGAHQVGREVVEGGDHHLGRDRPEGGGTRTRSSPSGDRRCPRPRRPRPARARSRRTRGRARASDASFGRASIRASSRVPPGRPGPSLCCRGTGAGEDRLSRRRRPTPAPVRAAPARAAPSWWPPDRVRRWSPWGRPRAP